MKRIALSFAFVLSTAQAGPWIEINQGTIEASSPTENIRQIPLHLIIEKGSEWENQEKIQKNIQETSKIFRKCGLEIGQVTYQTVVLAPEVREAYKNPNPYKGPTELILLEGIETALRPLVFLFKRSTVNTASAYNQKSISALSWGASYDPRGLLNISVISDNYTELKPSAEYLAGYNTFAHELAHILGDFGHIPEKGNLMSSLEAPGSKSGHLNSEQCRLMNQFTTALLQW